MNTSEKFKDIGNDNIDIIKEIRYYTFFWPWFLACIFITCLSSYIYLRYSKNIYSTNAVIQVKDAKSDPSSFLAQSSAAMFNFNRVKSSFEKNSDLLLS